MHLQIWEVPMDTGMDMVLKPELCIRLRDEG